MEAKLLCLCMLGILAVAKGQSANGWSSICQRFPNNPNCAGSSVSSSSSSSSSSFQASSSSSNSRPVDPTSLGLPPPPNQGGSSQPAPSPSASNNDPCSSWRPTYDKYCTGSNIPKEYQPSCSQFQQSCLGSSGSSGSGSPAGSNNPCTSWRSVYDKYCVGGNIQQQYQQSCAQFKQACLGGIGSSSGAQPQPQPQPQPAGAGSTWAALTQKAQEEQAAQALQAAQNGQANCGQYKDNYNVWCGGVKQVNELYCSALGRICQQQAANAAAGQSNSFGPFGNNNGLPTGGAGSTRPLTIGNQFGVGPFFGLGKTLGINPLQGVGSNEGVQIPIAGMNIQRTSGVDWGGLPGVAQLGAALGGRRRRWAIPVGVDQFGNVMYYIH